MSTRATPILLLLVALAFTGPAGAADKLSVQTLGARLAEKPSGDEAEALAEEIRVWFGKDRTGKLNVTSGANPKVEGLETAWAIEAPGAKTAAVVTSDDKTVPLDAGRRHADLRRHAPARRRVGIPLVRTSIDKDQKKRQGQLEVYTDQPELAEQPGVPKGKLTQQKAVGEQDLPQHQARLVGLRAGPVQGRRARLRHGLSGRRRATPASCRPSSTT